MNTSKRIHVQGPLLRSGVELSVASAVVVLIHGRGASADDILLIANELAVPDVAYLAPQATNNTWYPYSFLAPVEDNEPYLSCALAAIEIVSDDVVRAG